MSNTFLVLLATFPSFGWVRDKLRQKVPFMKNNHSLPDAGVVLLCNADWYYIVGLHAFQS